MNNVSLIGRLTRDPESVQTKNETQICNLRIAVDRRAQDGALYTDVKCFGKQAAACQEHLAVARSLSPADLSSTSGRQRPAASARAST